MAICRFGLAVNDRFKKDAPALFVDITVFNGQAETVSAYLQKGRQVLIEGRLNLSRWEDNDGNPRSKIEVIANDVRFLGSRENGSQNGATQSQARDNVEAEVETSEKAIEPDDVPY
jgi:single-strand DNA-binding protein